MDGDVDRHNWGEHHEKEFDHTKSPKYLDLDAHDFHVEFPHLPAYDEEYVVTRRHRVWAGIFERSGGAQLAEDYLRLKNTIDPFKIQPLYPQSYLTDLLPNYDFSHDKLVKLD